MPEVSPTPMFNATGLPVDPSTLIPGAAPRIHIAPPAAPGYFGASVNPGSQAQVPITTGYDTPPSPADKVRLAAAQVNAPPAQPGVPPAAAPPAPAGDTPSAVNDLLAQHDPAFDSFWARMVPGESGGKNVPNERYDATHTASGVAQITDTNWKAIAPRLGIDLTRYPTAMSAPAPYQKAVTKLFFRMEGQAPWDTAHGGALPVNDPYAASDAYWQGQVADIQKGYADRYEKNSKNLQQAIKQLQTGDADIDKAMNRIRAAQDKADLAQDEAKRAIAEQPKAPVLDGVKHLNSIAVLVGLLGGLFTKAPMLASTNAAASAIEAYNAGDLRAYNIAHDNWKNQTDLLFKIADMNATRVHDIITEEKIPIEEKRAKLNAYLQMVGQQDLAEQIKLQGMEVGLKYWQENERLKNERATIFETRDKGLPLQKPDGSWVLFHPLSNTETPMPGTPQGAVTRARQDLTPEDRQQVDRDLQTWLATDEGSKATQTDIDNKRYELGNEILRKKAATKREEFSPAENIRVVGGDGKILWPPSGDWGSAMRRRDGKGGWVDSSTQEPVPTGTIQQQKGGGRGGQAAQAPELTYPEKWEGMPDKPPPGVRADVWAMTLNYVQTFKNPPIPRNSPLMAQFEAAIPAAQHAMGITPSGNPVAYLEWQARQRRATAVEAAFSGGLIGRNLISLNTVADHLSLLKEYAKALQDNSDVTVINSILDRMATMSGAPEIIQFALAGTMAGDEVVRLLTTTGGTHEDRAGIQALLSPYGSAAQIFGAIDVASRFVASRYEPLEVQYVSAIPELAQQRREFFNTNLVTPKARELYQGEQQRRAGEGGGGSQGGGSAHPPVPAAIRDQENELQWSEPRQQFKNKRTGQVYDLNGNAVPP